MACCFSWTAPRCTQQDMEKETSSLSTDEVIRVQEDLYGTIMSTTAQATAATATYHNKGPLPLPSLNTHDCHDSMNNDDAVVLLDHFYDALSLIPPNEKQSYLRALEIAPDLVRTETDPLLFLRACQEGDDHKIQEPSQVVAMAAALRLVRYWEWRCRAFGDELAFLPMTLDGAMSSQRGDMDSGLRVLLGLGWIRILPKDQQGRVLLYLDNRIFLPAGGSNNRTAGEHPSRETLLRVLFYLSHVAIECLSKNQEQSYDQQVPTYHRPKQQGIVCLVNMRSCENMTYKGLDRRITKEIFETLFTNILPLQLKALHVCLPTGRAASHRNSICNFILPIWNHCLGRHVRLRTVVHDQDSQCRCKVDLMARLEETYGIPPSCLPHELGGDLKERDFHAWLNRRNDDRSRVMAVATAPVSAINDNSDIVRARRMATTLPILEVAARGA